MNMNATNDEPTHDEAIAVLDAIAEGLEDGIHDYLKDNSMLDYLDIGEGRADIELLEAIQRVRDHVVRLQNEANAPGDAAHENH